MLYFVLHCPGKIDKCPTNFWLGQTFVLPSKIIICGPVASKVGKVPNKSLVI
jgi:hypothetical protein